MYVHIDRYIYIYRERERETESQNDTCHLPPPPRIAAPKKAGARRTSGNWDPLAATLRHRRPPSTRDPNPAEGKRLGAGGPPHPPNFSDSDAMPKTILTPNVHPGLRNPWSINSGASPFSGDSDHFWREHPQKNGTGL